MVLITLLACSVAWSSDSQDVTIGDYLLLRVRCPAGGYSIDQRVAALQQRANDLLRGGKTTMTITVSKSGNDAIIYTDGTLFMTVTQADAKANGTTTDNLANTWAQRLQSRFPKATPDKPGVGRPGRPTSPKNAK